MRVCILGTGLSSLTLAKALVNLKIYVDVVGIKKTNKISIEFYSNFVGYDLTYLAIIGLKLIIL